MTDRVSFASLAGLASSVSWPDWARPPMPKEGGFADHHLHKGETFELGPEVWEVTEIVDANTDGWGAELTRLR